MGGCETGAPGAGGCGSGNRCSAEGEAGSGRLEGVQRRDSRWRARSTLTAASAASASATSKEVAAMLWMLSSTHLSGCGL